MVFRNCEEVDSLVATLQAELPLGLDKGATLDDALDFDDEPIIVKSRPGEWMFQRCLAKARHVWLMRVDVDPWHVDAVCVGFVDVTCRACRRIQIDALVVNRLPVDVVADGRKWTLSGGGNYGAPQYTCKFFPDDYAYRLALLERSPRQDARPWRAVLAGQELRASYAGWAKALWAIAKGRI